MWRDDARLLDMLLAAKELSKYTEGVTPEEFDRNRILQHGVIRAPFYLESLHEECKRRGLVREEVIIFPSWHSPGGTKLILITRPTLNAGGVELETGS